MMTSKQIKTRARGSQAFWLQELAFQFAVFNERNARVDEYNAEADAKDAESRLKSQIDLSTMIQKGTATLDRLGRPYPEAPFFVPAPPPKEH